MKAGFGWPIELFYECYNRQKQLWRSLTRLKVALTSAAQLIQAESNEKAISVSELMGTLNLEEVQKLALNQQLVLKSHRLTNI